MPLLHCGWKLLSPYGTNNSFILTFLEVLKGLRWVVWPTWKHRVRSWWRGGVTIIRSGLPSLTKYSEKSDCMIVHSGSIYGSLDHPQIGFVNESYVVSWTDRNQILSVMAPPLRLWRPMAGQSTWPAAVYFLTPFEQRFFVHLKRHNAQCRRGYYWKATGFRSLQMDSMGNDWPATLCLGLGVAQWFAIVVSAWRWIIRMGAVRLFRVYLNRARKANSITYYPNGAWHENIILRFLFDLESGKAIDEKEN